MEISLYIEEFHSTRTYADSVQCQDQSLLLGQSSSDALVWGPDMHCSPAYCREEHWERAKTPADHMADSNSESDWSSLADLQLEVLHPLWLRQSCVIESAVICWASWIWAGVFANTVSLVEPELAGLHLLMWCPKASPPVFWSPCWWRQNQHNYPDWLWPLQVAIATAEDDDGVIAHKILQDGQCSVFCSSNLLFCPQCSAQAHMSQRKYLCCYGRQISSFQQLSNYYL